MTGKQTALVGSAPTQKKCRICRLVKPLEEFHRNGSTVDGRKNDCKKCWNAARRGEESRRTESANIPVTIYQRNCNRCDRRYKGPGRLLCPACFDWANGVSGGGIAEVGFSPTGGRVPRKGGA